MAGYSVSYSVRKQRMGQTRTKATVKADLPDFGHHGPVLHHERVADGCHQREGLLARRVPPDQVQQRVGLLFCVQLLQALLSDVGH